MARPGSSRGNGGDFESLLQEIGGLSEGWERLRSVGPLLPAVAAVAVVLLWLASGAYIVEPGEQGVVRRFGREVAKTAPGLNWHWPFPIERVDVVNIDVVRRIEVGFRSFGRGLAGDGRTRARLADAQRVPAEALMLTGDENIVDAQMIVQYQVRDPSQYLFRLREPEQSLHAAAEVALRSAVGNSTIDDVLTIGRLQVQENTLRFLQQLMDIYESGLTVTEVKLQTVDPPDQVKDAFAEVVRAREDRERLINQAQGYREDVLPKARGEAQKILRQAEAYREERILRAQGDGARFTALATAYRQAPRVTRDRLHLEAVERVLGRAEKVLVDGAVGKGVLPFLPLRDGGAGNRPTPDTRTGAEVNR